MKNITFVSILALTLLNCTDSKTKTVATKPTLQKQKNVAGFAPVNGISMYYEIHDAAGEEPTMPLVLIHGGGSTVQTSFAKILPFFMLHHKVIAVELQAHGHTSDRNAPESFEQDANDMATLLAYLKISKANFLGFSNGGHTAMQIGINHPGIVNKLVIVSAFYKRDGAVKGFFEGLENGNLGNMPGPLKEAYLKIKNDSAGLQNMFNKDRERMLRFTDWSDKDLSSIKAPCLIVAGDKDVVTPEHAVRMSRLIPNAEVMIVPGTHGSFIGEVCTAIPGSKMPEAIAAIIEEFLK